MKYFISLILVVFAFSCSKKTVVNENIYSRYINSDLNYFFENDIDDDLFMGLKSIVTGDYFTAEKIINQIIPNVSDSLKKNLYNDLAFISFFQKNWAKGNKYLQLSDSSLNKNNNPYFFFSNYPKESFSMLCDTVSINYDGFYIQGKINNQEEFENIILDTGASPSTISFSLARKYNLKIDSTQFSSNFSGFGIKTKFYSTVIKHLKLNGVDFYNIPVFVISDDIFTKINLKGQFILGLTEISLFDCVEFDYPQNKFTMIKKVLKNENIKPNFSILVMLQSFGIFK